MQQIAEVIVSKEKNIYTLFACVCARAHVHAHAHKHRYVRLRYVHIHTHCAVRSVPTYIEYQGHRGM